MINENDIKAFQKKILTWYGEHKRSLPWRDAPYGASLKDGSYGAPLQERAYKVFISEVMSQQTQINRVVPKYKDWMKSFPTIADLANAKVSDVLHYWSGLGYNRRALNLKKAAEIIVKQYAGKFPTTEKELLSLPGIGKYTARAILCFAFDQQVSVVDTNVRKVIITQFLSESRIMNQESRTKEKNHDSFFELHNSTRKNLVSEKELENIAQMLLPVGKAYDWNQALMDYAAEVLKKHKIVIPKQSKFIGSHRYYRGQILKNLLAKKKIEIAKIGFLIKKNYTDAENEWLEKLIQELVDEGFIVAERGMLVLAS